jgi:hypothetical protein
MMTTLPQLLHDRPARAGRERRDVHPAEVRVDDLLQAREASGSPTRWAMKRTARSTSQPAADQRASGETTMVPDITFGPATGEALA